MFADTPLVKNLGNPDYMKIMPAGKKSLEEKFAEVNHKEVIRKMQKAGNVKSKISRKHNIIYSYPVSFIPELIILSE